MLKELLPRCDQTLKATVVEMAAEYEQRVQLGSRPIFHLEAFVARIMSLYKLYLDEAFALSGPF